MYHSLFEAYESQIKESQARINYQIRKSVEKGTSFFSHYKQYENLQMVLQEALPGIKEKQIVDVFVKLMLYLSLKPEVDKIVDKEFSAEIGRSVMEVLEESQLN